MFLRKSYLFLVFTLLLFSCNKQYQKILKGNDLEAKLRIADEYYAKKKYDKCIPIYEEMLTVLKGQKSVDEIYYKYANAHYLNKSYELAAFYLRSFYNTYPGNSKAEDAAYDEAMCYMKVSPRYSLEQVSTEKAIVAFQEFINKYPQSKRMEEANARIDELRGKLRKKAYENAYLYYKIGQYYAASVALTNFLNDFPEYEQPEKVNYLIVRSLKRYAEGSYKNKQAERYKDYEKSLEAFRVKYPNSTYLAELSKSKHKKK